MAREVMTIRLDRALRTRLAAACGPLGLTPSAATRLAIDAWLEAQEAEAGNSPYEQLATLVGCVEAPSLVAAGPTKAATARRAGP